MGRSLVGTGELTISEPEKGFQKPEKSCFDGAPARSLKINAKARGPPCIGPGKSLERNQNRGTKLISSFLPTKFSFRIGFDRFSSVGRPTIEN